ncbi:MAG TPA: hypothetical protein VKB24_05480 [Candidatus Acidoferrum sp.]|nr:hypothetical protein [Candidatus Acidoferrum sp.]
MRVYLPVISLFLLGCLGVGGPIEAAGNDRQSDNKTVTSKSGEPHFEAPLPSGARLRLYVRSGDIRLVGSDDARISVDISGKKAQKMEDVKHRLVVLDGTAEFHLSGGPRNDVQITIRLPRNCDLYLRVPAGDVSIEGISGNKDIELHAGDLSIHVGNPEEYGHVDASVSAGDVEASPFGESHSGLFRSFMKSGSGKFKLHAHVGAGDLTLL